VLKRCISAASGCGLSAMTNGVSGRVSQPQMHFYIRMFLQ
jgi:hypothetical protein